MQDLVGREGSSSGTSIAKEQWAMHSQDGGVDVRDRRANNYMRQRIEMPKKNLKYLVRSERQEPEEGKVLGVGRRCCSRNRAVLRLGKYFSNSLLKNLTYGKGRTRATKSGKRPSEMSRTTGGPRLQLSGRWSSFKQGPIRDDLLIGGDDSWKI